MSDDINLGTYPEGVEVWGSHDCPVCGGEHTVSERMWHGETWCSDCETEFETILRPVD